MLLYRVCDGHLLTAFDFIDCRTYSHTLPDKSPNAPTTTQNASAQFVDIFLPIISDSGSLARIPRVRTKSLTFIAARGKKMEYTPRSLEFAVSSLEFAASVHQLPGYGTKHFGVSASQGCLLAQRQRNCLFHLLFIYHKPTLLAAISKMMVVRLTKGLRNAHIWIPLGFRIPMV